LFVSGVLWLQQSGITALDFFKNVGVKKEELMADEKISFCYSRK